MRLKPPTTIRLDKATPTTRYQMSVLQGGLALEDWCLLALDIYKCDTRNYFLDDTHWKLGS